LIKNSQPFGKQFQKTTGGIFLTHTVHFGGGWRRECGRLCPALTVWNADRIANFLPRGPSKKCSIRWHYYLIIDSTDKITRIIIMFIIVTVSVIRSSTNHNSERCHLHSAPAKCTQRHTIHGRSRGPTAS